MAKYVKTMEGYDAQNENKVAQMTKAAQEQFFGFILMENADQIKYGSLRRNLNSQKSQGNDQYPKTIADACEVLSNHRFDNYNKTNKKKEQKESGHQNQTKTIQKATTTPLCYCSHSWKENAVEKQGTSCRIATRKIRFRRMNGPSTSLNNSLYKSRLLKKTALLATRTTSQRSDGRDYTTVSPTSTL